MKHSKKSGKFILFICTALLVMILLFGWSFLFTPAHTTDPTALAEGLAYLDALENQDAADINALILAADQTMAETVFFDSSVAEQSSAAPDTNERNQTAAPEENEANSLAAPETAPPSSDPVQEEDAQLLSWKAQIDSASITNLTEEERASYRSRLSSCAVIGDSMAQAALEYGFLDGAHVFYRRGYAVGQLGDAIAEAAAMLPSTVIFFTGLNDTDYYAEPELYAAAYLEKIQELKALLPNARVFVCSMLPPGNALGAVRPDLARAPLYDDALHRMCDEQGIGYIDTTWMVNQSLYMEDGIHFVSSFYDIWIQYVTKCAGL